MPLPKAFWDRLPRQTDAELLEALARPTDYEPEAIQAIQAEWSRRDLPRERIETLALRIVRALR